MKNFLDHICSSHDVANIFLRSPWCTDILVAGASVILPGEIFHSLSPYSSLYDEEQDATPNGKRKGR